MCRPLQKKRKSDYKTAFNRKKSRQHRTWLPCIIIVMICLFVCLFVFILKLLQYCNYIIIVMQIKLMLLLLLLYDHSTDFQSKSILRALRQQKEKRDTHLSTYQTWHMCNSHNTVVMDYQRVMDVHCEAVECLNIQWHPSILYRRWFVDFKNNSLYCTFTWDNFVIVDNQKKTGISRILIIKEGNGGNCKNCKED